LADTQNCEFPSKKRDDCSKSKSKSKENYRGLNTYKSPRDFTNIMRSTMNEKIVE